MKQLCQFIMCELRGLKLVPVMAAALLGQFAVANTAMARCGRPSTDPKVIADEQAYGINKCQEEWANLRNASFEVKKAWMSYFPSAYPSARPNSIFPSRHSRNTLSVSASHSFAQFLCRPAAADAYNLCKANGHFVEACEQ